LIFNSLPKEFETFEVNYNSMNEKWTLEKFMTMCVVSWKRRGSSITMVVLTVSTWPSTTTRRDTFVSKPAPKNEEKGKGVARPPAKKDKYKWFFKRGRF
jgi:hypothetical protein